jgi:hypothetical protein
MNKVRVTVQTSFTYEYGSRANHLTCGAIMYFNPSLEKELDELKFVMSSVYLKRGFLSLEESIKEDFQNKAGIFAEKTIVSKQVSDNNIVEKEVTEVSIDPIVENIIVETITLEDRKSQLEDKKAAEVKVIADELGIEEYTNKAAAIEYILKVEYPE